MRIAALVGLAALSFAVPSFAQSTANGTTPPAVVSPNDTNKTSAAPVAGKNSFTAKQVTKRLQDNGYSNVTGLMKDDQSIWHAKAMKAGAPVSVTVDYQGNITTN